MEVRQVFEGIHDPLVGQVGLKEAICFHLFQMQVLFQKGIDPVPLHITVGADDDAFVIPGLYKITYLFYQIRLDGFDAETVRHHRKLQVLPFQIPLAVFFGFHQSADMACKGNDVLCSA